MMHIEETTLKDGTKIYRTDDGSFFIKIYALGETSVEEMCKKHNCTTWNEEYNREINSDFRKEFPIPTYLEKSSMTPFYLKLTAAEKEKVNTYIRNGTVALITGVDGPHTAQFGARMSGSPLTIRTYAYSAKFSRELTEAEKISLKDLEWAVQTENSDGTKRDKPIKLAQKGISVNLTIAYEHTEGKIYVGPLFNGFLVYAKAKETNVTFSVPLVPEIMKRITDPKTATTIYPVAISLQNKWFNTAARSIFAANQADFGKSFDNTLVTLSWVRGFTRGKKIYDKFVSRDYWFSKDLKENLIKRFEANGLLGGSSKVLWAGFPTGRPLLTRLPNPATDMQLFNACYEQHLAWDYTMLDPNDDLKATLANCDWRMAFEGEIAPKDADKKQLVTITKCAVYIRDSFDFVGSQTGGLGDWRAHPPAISGGTIGGGFTDVDNAMYRDWRTVNGIGHDFLVYSNVEYFAPSPGAQFRILENATWGGLGSRIEDV